MDLSNVANWRYKNKAEVEALTDAELIEEAKDMYNAMRLFSRFRIPMTDEMFWLFVTVTRLLSDRNLKVELNPNFSHE